MLCMKLLVEVICAGTCHLIIGDSSFDRSVASLVAGASIGATIGRPRSSPSLWSLGRILSLLGRGSLHLASDRAFLMLAASSERYLLTMRLFSC